MSASKPVAPRHVIREHVAAELTIQWREHLQGRRAIGGPRGKGSRATHSQAFKWNGAAAGAAAAGAAAAGAPEASSSEDTDDLSDDSDDASDSSDDSSSSSSDSGLTC
eukprot:COSAG02_NODE_7828_length_2831_cov_1.731698_4_plen_108_part_00